jgi:predicted dehydrogenase
LNEWRSGGYWRRDAAKMGGGPFADAGSHAADLALWLCGAAPVEVFAQSDKADLPVDCFLGVQARLANGVLLSLAYSSGVPGAIRSQLTVLGDRGTLHTGFAGMGDVAARDVCLETSHGRGEIEPAGADRTTDEAFVDTVLEGKPNPAPGPECIRAVAFTEAVHRSLQERAPVQVDPGSVEEGVEDHE